MELVNDDQIPDLQKEQRLTKLLSKIAGYRASHARLLGKYNAFDHREKFIQFTKKYFAVEDLFGRTGGGRKNGEISAQSFARKCLGKFVVEHQKTIGVSPTSLSEYCDVARLYRGRTDLHELFKKEPLRRITYQEYEEEALAFCALK